MDLLIHKMMPAGFTFYPGAKVILCKFSWSLLARAVNSD